MRKRPEHIWKEDVFKRAYYFDTHDNMLYSALLQDNRRAILEENAFFRNNPELLKTLSFGKMQLRIPDVDRKILGERLGLDHDDPETRRLAWQRFLNSPRSDPYRVVPRDKTRSAGSKKQIRGYLPTKETNGILLSIKSHNELTETQEQKPHEIESTPEQPQVSDAIH